MAIILKKLKGDRDDSTSDWKHLLNLIKILVVLFILFSGFHWVIKRKVHTLPASTFLTKTETEAKPAANRVKIYTVRSGDTLWSIASQQYPNADPTQKAREIEKLNELEGKSIRTGQPLKLP